MGTARLLEALTGIDAEGFGKGGVTERTMLRVSGSTNLPALPGALRSIFHWREYMNRLFKGFLVGLVLTAMAIAPVVAQQSTDTATLAAGGRIGNVNSSAAFTAGASCTVSGYVTAVAAVTLGAGTAVSGNVSTGAAFTSGDSVDIIGSVSSKAAFTSGANSTIGSNVTVGGDFTSGANSVISGNVYVTGSVTLGAGSRILGSVHSGTGVITYGAGATIGSVN
jgi:predicted acyltransferase (DUF342 family)